MLSYYVVRKQEAYALTFSTRCSDGDAVSRVEERRLCDGVMDFSFEYSEETVFAYLLPGLWTSQDRFCISTECTALRCHRLRSISRVKKLFREVPAR